MLGSGSKFFSDRLSILAKTSICDLEVSNLCLFETSHNKLMANLDVFDLNYMECLSYLLGFETKQAMEGWNKI